jgi:hypothetical protein
MRKMDPWIRDSQRCKSTVSHLYLLSMPQARVEPSRVIKKQSCMSFSSCSLPRGTRMPWWVCVCVCGGVRERGCEWGESGIGVLDKYYVDVRGRQKGVDFLFFGMLTHLFIIEDGDTTHNQYKEQSHTWSSSGRMISSTVRTSLGCACLIPSYTSLDTRIPAPSLVCVCVCRGR